MSKQQRHKNQKMSYATHTHTSCLFPYLRTLGLSRNEILYLLFIHLFIITIAHVVQNKRHFKLVKTTLKT